MKITELVSAKANIKKPVRYDNESQQIFDAVDDLILDVRGWGRLKYIENGSDIQDHIGLYIAECINSCRDELILID